MRKEWLRNEIAVIGLARSGRAVATLLARGGADVYASDVGRSPEIEATAAALRAEGVVVDVGVHDQARIVSASLVVVSPGVPPTAPPLVVARKAQIDIVSEVEIGLRFLPQLCYVAVTGTNGKTTTTALAGHLLSQLRRQVVTAGNIGLPLSEVALASAPPRWLALELSSFQLHDTPSVAPRVGVLTNLSANHLDRYDNVEEYYADKARLFRNATAASTWVSNADDTDVQKMVERVPGIHCRFSTQGMSDAYLDHGTGELVVLGHVLIHRDELALIGEHNVSNALAATLAVMMADPQHRETESVAKLAQGLRSFRGLEHRIEPVGEFGGVTWINDSKSTNVASTLVALRGMTRPTVLLLGGRHKGEPYTQLAPELARVVKGVIAYGEAAPLVEADLREFVPVTRLESSFDDVIETARRSAQPGDVILLSPACSSYDMFDNYEQRGAEFKRLAPG
jgi:UDP-N-acetylmuramoylalanine--D-glutamate ligase